MSNPFGGFVPGKLEPELVEPVDGVFEEVLPETNTQPQTAPDNTVPEVVPDTVFDIEAISDEGAADYRHQLGLISPVALSKILDVHTDTLKVWRAGGKGPGYLKIGKRLWYYLPYLVEWLPSKKVERVREESEESTNVSNTEKGLQQDERPEGRQHD